MAVAILRSILLLLGGSVSDRLPPSVILIVGNLVQAISVAIVAFLAWHKMLVLWSSVGMSSRSSVALDMASKQPPDRIPNPHSTTICSLVLTFISGLPR
jgi:hypothetical protein